MDAFQILGRFLPFLFQGDDGLVQLIQGVLRVLLGDVQLIQLFLLHHVQAAQGLLPGDGNSLLPSTQQSQPAEVKSEQPEEILNVSEDDGVLTIRVHEHAITLEDAELSAEELEQKLLSLWHEGDPVELVDDGAIKADYDAVVAVLERLKIPFVRVG